MSSGSGWEEGGRGLPVGGFVAKDCAEWRIRHASLPAFVFKLICYFWL